MWRLNLLHLSARIGVLVGLTGLLIQCQVVPDDEIPPALRFTKVKGSLIGDPVVQTAPTNVTVITVNNGYDKLLSGRYGPMQRPTKLFDYRRFDSAWERISAQQLADHEFNWQPTDAKIMMVAIFQNVVQVDTINNEILNKEDLVWLWTPPDGTSDPGTARFVDGKSAKWDKATNEYVFDTAVSLPATANLPNYVWCVLAWDRQGYAIRQASRELPLLITK